MEELERLEGLLDHGDIDRPPVITPLHAATMDLMMAVGVHAQDLLGNPPKMAVLARAAHDLMGFENVTLPFHESVELTAFGTVHVMTAQRLPQDVYRQRLAADIDGLEVPDPLSSPAISAVLSSVRLLQAELATTPIFLETSSPIMLAMQLRGLPESLMDMQLDPHRMKMLLAKCTEFLRRYVEAASERGMDQIVLNDPMANSDVIGPAQFPEFVEAYDDAVVNEIRRRGIESILHACGHLDEARLTRMVEIDVDAISIGEGVPVQTAKVAAARKHMAVIGNISPTRTLLAGTVADTETCTRECIDAGIDAVAPGCHLELFTPMQNVLAMTRTAKAYGAGRRFQKEGLR